MSVDLELEVIAIPVSDIDRARSFYAGLGWAVDADFRYEPTAPKHHWSGWYAAYVIARERGRSPDEAAKEATIHIEAGLAAQA